MPYGEPTREMIGDKRLAFDRVVGDNKTMQSEEKLNCNHAYGWDVYCDSYVYDEQFLTHSCKVFKYCPFCGERLVA